MAYVRRVLEILAVPGGADNLVDFEAMHCARNRENAPVREKLAIYFRGNP